MPKFSSATKGPATVALLNQLDAQVQALAAIVASGGGGGGTTTPNPPAPGATVLAPPANGQVTAFTVTSISLAWSAVTNATGYNVYRNGIKANTTPLTSTTFTDVELTGKTSYEYTFKTLNNVGESVASAAVTATTATPPLTAPPAPNGLVASLQASDSMRLSWNAASTATGYDVYVNGTKKNTSTITGLNYVISALTASTTYTLGVQSVNGAGTSPMSATIQASTTAAPVSGLTPMYSTVLAGYFEAYRTDIPITSVSLRYNVIKLFHARPKGTAVNDSYTNVGDGTFHMPNMGEPQISVDKLKIVHERGQKIILTCGGAGAGFNFDSRPKSQKFVDSVILMISQLGGYISGIDFNTVEAGVGGSAAEYVWIAQQLRAKYGPNFAITAPMGPSAPNDRVLTKALKDAGCLTYVAPQYYDWSGHKTPGYVAGNVQEWVNLVGAEYVVVGASANYWGYFANGRNPTFYEMCLTEAEWERELTTIKNNNPNFKGIFVWNIGYEQSFYPVSGQSGNGTFTTKFKPFIGASDVVAVTGNALSGGTPTNPEPTPEPATGNEASLTSAMSGQNGGWYTAQPQYFHTTAAGGTALTGYEQPFGRIIDRSGNTNHLEVGNGTDRGTLRISGSVGFADMYYGYQSRTGGGSGDTNSSGGFFWVGNFTPAHYYTRLYDDAGTPNTGRIIHWSSDENAVIFSVGTGAARVEVRATIPGTTLYVTPPATINPTIICLQDASGISIQVDNGPIDYKPCAPVSPGSVNFSSPSILDNNITHAPSKMRGMFFTLNALTSTLRDPAIAYMKTLK